MRPNSFIVSPENEISFNYLPQTHLRSSIKLTNTSDDLLAFKIKTNVPVCYLVKPNLGCIQSHSTLEIFITMQPTNYNPQTASISDKFLINVVPLPPNTDPTPLSDPARLHQLWDTAPQTQIKSHKLKVVLRFEGESANTNVPDKTAEDALKQVTTDNGATTLINCPVGDGSLIERNETQQAATNNIKQSATESVEKKKDVEEEKKSLESNVAPRTFEERIAFLEKRAEASENDKRSLNQRYQEITGKAETQKRLLFDLSEENARLKSELGNLKSSTFKSKPANTEGQNVEGYEFWHVLLGIIVGLIMGAYLSSR